MPEREFASWVAYANKRLLPTRRMEFYLAQIAMLIARYMGGVENMTLRDYLFDPAPEEETNDDLEAAKRAFNFKPGGR